MENIIELFKDFWIQLASGTILALLTIFHKKFASWLFRFIRYMILRVRKVINMQITCPVPEIVDTLKNIQKELRPNGGSSLRDAINKIDTKVTALSSKLAAMQASHDIMSDTLNICRWASDVNGKIIFINSPLKRLLGSTDDLSLLGDGWTNSVLKEDRDNTICEWMRCVNAGIEYNDDFRVLNLQKGIIRITSHAKPSRNMHTGIIEGWVGVVIPHDNTE